MLLVAELSLIGSIDNSTSCCILSIGLECVSLRWVSLVGAVHFGAYASQLCINRYAFDGQSRKHQRAVVNERVYYYF